MLLQPNRARKSPRQQAGVVIVVALFIVALVAALSYVMIARLNRDIRRTSLVLHDVQAEYYAQGSVFWAMDQLRDDWLKRKKDRIIDRIPLVSPVTNEEGYHIRSVIYDAQARFNINNLSSPKAKQAYIPLVRRLHPNLKEDQILVPAGSFSCVGELLYTKGMTPELFDALKPFIIALPAQTPLNVQTASADALTMLSPALSLASSKMLEQYRKHSPFITPEAFLSQNVVMNQGITSDQIAVMSRYFLVQTTVTIEKQAIVLYTLLERVVSDQKVAVSIVWQSKGVWS